MVNKYDYDAIIIGAGISGLVCGCYLAKAGMKTLIVEKNAQPGGYCTSFSRGKYHFDACVHALSSLRKGGVLYKLISDLGIEKSITFRRNDPTDIIITPDFEIKYYSDVLQTINEFQKYFPEERTNIEAFFTFIANSDVKVYVKLRNMTFQQLLDSYFDNIRLKMLLGTVITGLVGTFPNKLSAIVGALIYREFVFDGGYYPVGGMQEFPNTLLNRFKELGGRAILLKSVQKISAKDRLAKNVILNDGQEITAKHIIAACDLRKTFFELLERSNGVGEILHSVESKEPSHSAFMVYLGLKSNKMDTKNMSSNIWVVDNYDMEKSYNNFLKYENDFIAITNPSAKGGEVLNSNMSMTISALTPYRRKEDWTEIERHRFSELLINNASRIFPDLRINIDMQFNATSHTLYKWTWNYRGAAYGWASTCEQFCDPDLSQQTRIDNLYLTGHWSNLGSGITSVINCSFDTADLILRKEKIEK